MPTWTAYVQWERGVLPRHGNLLATEPSIKQSRTRRCTAAGLKSDEGNMHSLSLSHRLLRLCALCVALPSLVGAQVINQDSYTCNGFPAVPADNGVYYQTCACLPMKLEAKADIRSRYLATASLTSCNASVEHTRMAWILFPPPR